MRKEFNFNTWEVFVDLVKATWLDKMQDLRRKIKHRQTPKIIQNCATPEKLQEADIRFKGGKNAARGKALQTDRQDVGE